MCMDLNGQPCSFLDTHLNCVSKSCDHTSCYEEASVLVEHGPKVWSCDHTSCYEEASVLVEHGPKVWD